MSTANSKKQAQLIEQLTEICGELGWLVGIPKEEGDDGPVEGLIVGTEKFLGIVLERAFDDYEVYAQDEGTGSITELPTGEQNQQLNKKKPTFH